MPASGADLEAELAPLRWAASTRSTQAAQIDADAQEEAGRIRERTGHEAAAILEAARGSADAERVRAASERGRQARRDAERLRVQAQAEAARIRARREEAVAELVAEVLECVSRTGH